MKKILLSVLAITLTVGLVSGAAYAVFSDTAEVNGIAISTGNADLRINGANNLSNALDVDNVYPGWMDGEKFYLTNNSSSNIGLEVTAKIREKSQDWNILKDEIKVRVLEYVNESHANNDLNDGKPGENISTPPTKDTGWKTLEEWKASEKEITGSPISQNDTRYYVVWGYVNSSAGNNIAQKNVRVNYDLVGTQAN